MADPTWKPSTASVAALIPSRVKEPGIGRVNDFSTETQPTKVEVELLIDEACWEVVSAVGLKPCTDDLSTAAGKAATKLAAMLVEQGNWPEQTQVAGSSFNALDKLYTRQIKTLTEAVGDQCGGSGEATGGTSAQMPREGSDEEPLIGRAWPAM